MQLSLIELSFSTVGNKVKKSNSENSAMLFCMTKNFLIKKPIGKKLPEVSKRIFPRREKNAWKLHCISIIAHFFHWIFLLYFHNTLFRSHFSGYTEQTNSIIWPSIECLFKTFIFNLKWKEWASREKKKEMVLSQANAYSC